MTERSARPHDVAACLAVAVLLAAGFACDPAPAVSIQTDGSAEPMRLSWTSGSLPSLSGDGETGGDDARGSDEVQVSPTGDPHPVPVAHDINFRHIVHEGGPAGCVYTASPQPDGTLRGAGGGRECPMNDKDWRCGYIAEGWDVYALAGGSCAAFGIEVCEGPFCY